MKLSIHHTKPYVIAEIGMNHDGSFGNALRLIEEAASAGVAAVKFQLHISAAETLPSAPTPPYFKLEDRFSYFNRTAFTVDEWQQLRDYAHEYHLAFIASPFSIEAADILTQLKVDAFKIASGEVTNHPLLAHITHTGLPVLLSSGMSNWAEVDAAAGILKKNLITVFQCSSTYPCPPQAVGLNVISEMHKRYPKIAVGFSDHTLDNASSIAALVNGARVFEKHFTLSKNMYGPDARFSLEPHEMKRYVDGLHFVAAALERPVDKDDLMPFHDMKHIFEKSIVAARDLPVGHVLAMADLAFKKPGNGLRADRYHELLGKKLSKEKQRDEFITLQDVH